jgi:hypothetical protein
MWVFTGSALMAVVLSTAALTQFSICSAKAGTISRWDQINKMTVKIEKIHAFKIPLGAILLPPFIKGSVFQTTK